MTNTSIATNANNDIYVDSGGNLALVVGIDAVKQDCEHALKAQFGEMFLTPIAGMPTLQDIWLNQNLIKWEAVARQTLQNTNGVVRVISFNMSLQSDTFVYTTQILTIYSSTLLTVTGILDN